MPDGEDLDRIDHALLRLRRFVSAPASMPHDGRRVEASTVLVVDAVLRLGATTVSEVAAAVDVTHSTASRLVARAVAMRALTRRTSVTDPRAAELSVTAAGRDLHEAARRHRHGILIDLTEGWSDADRGTFAALLDRFTTPMR
ncbi:MAG: MarR family winged helix-turn-helix transcriptional regulator [Dermatophilaceae bacterium]